MENIYQKSGHGLKQPITFSEVLIKEKEYPNAIVDADLMFSKAMELLGNRITNKALDIGSGYGFFTAAVLKKGFEVVAVNSSKRENAIFQQMNGFSPEEKFIEDVDFPDGEEFSLVIMSQVLEHIDGVERVLLNVQSLLAERAVML